MQHISHSHAREVQKQAFEIIANASNGVILEIPTGEGKTEIGMTTLKALATRGQGPLFYVTPTKTLVEQVQRLFPGNVSVTLGRSEYPCLYYINRGHEGVTAEQSPCYMLKCHHRVNQETGETEEEGADPCPYFLAKYRARQDAKTGSIIVCTTAFFLTNRLLVPGWRDDDPACVVLDEAHKIAKVARGIFEFTITDYHLNRTARILARFDIEQAKVLLRFRAKFMALARKRQSLKPRLIEENDITALLNVVRKLDETRIERIIRKAIADGKIDPIEDKTELKLLEDLVRTIPRFVNSFRYATTEVLGDTIRQPLNYVIAFYYRKDDHEFVGTRRRARYHLTIKGYYMVPIIRKTVGGNLIAMSATIGDPRVYGFESGLKHEFHSFVSSFSADQTRVFMPTNTPNLAQKKSRRDDPKKARKAVIEAAAQFADKGHRSLIVTVSDEERQGILMLAKAKGLNALSYGNGVTAKDTAKRFAAGEGQMLVGTAAHYAEGIDLPRGIAPIIFFLRPGYQRPDDPEAQFEQRRFSKGHCWALWNYRVMLEALQVRGRNIRSAEDVGVCIFVSQQFRRFLYASLPEWLKPAYVGTKTMEQVTVETLELIA